MPTIRAFGPFRLDISAEILFRGAEPLPVGRRALALLRALIERPGMPVAKDALIEAAWPGLAVEESNLTVQIASLRRALGEEAGGEHWIETLPRRGYRFVGPVATEETTDAPAPPPVEPPSLILPGKPSIAVLPFQNMSSDHEQAYFADGIAEDIITLLSRSQSLFVIARNSSFTYKGRSVDVKQIARELGVRYVLEGSVRRGSTRVRITAQLVDAVTGNHLWAERYDRDPADIFAVQDEITEAVAIAIEPAVAGMERRRAVRKPPESLDAWEAYQRGLWHMARGSVTDNKAAKSFFRRAIDLDPSFAPAHAKLAIAIFYGASTYQFFGASSDQAMSIAEALAEALPVADRAMALDPLCAEAYISIGSVRLNQGDHEGALAAARRALAISPNYATAHQYLATALLFSGRPRESLEPMRRAIRLDPHDPQQINRLCQIANAHYFLREYEAAVEVEKDALRSYPDHPHAYRGLAAALGQAGRMEEAKQVMEKLIAVAPKSLEMYVRRCVAWMRVEDYEHMLEGLRKAGWEG
jgi:adenylate cyclase